MELFFKWPVILLFVVQAFVYAFILFALGLEQMGLNETVMSTLVGWRDDPYRFVVCVCQGMFVATVMTWLTVPAFVSSGRQRTD